MSYKNKRYIAPAVTLMAGEILESQFTRAAAGNYWNSNLEKPQPKWNLEKIFPADSTRLSNDGSVMRLTLRQVPATPC
jgi:hypothetical protein